MMMKMKTMMDLGTGEAARQGKTGNLVGQGEMKGKVRQRRRKWVERKARWEVFGAGAR